MLVRFSVSNFLSFFDEQELTLFPSKVRSFRSHVYSSGSEKNPDVLKSAVIYGANSSGKSNLVKAMDFSKQIVISDQKGNWEVPAFKLNKTPRNESKFTFEILINNSCYNLQFTISEGLVKEESVKVVTKYAEKLLYSRQTDGEKVFVNFQMPFKDKNSEKFHNTISKGTRKNQLFLNFINQQNPSETEDDFRNIYDWFRNNLIITFPNSKVAGIEVQLLNDQDLWKFYNNCLYSLDTGIDKLKFDDFDFNDPKFQIPDIIKADIKQKLQDDSTVTLVSNAKNETYVVKKENDTLMVHKIKAIHLIKDQDKYIEFDLSSESDGTNRIMDLIPMLYLLRQNHTIIIDEIDRSFHSLISSKIFDLFFKSSAGNPSQLIATTHDLSLLSLDRLRRDEIWFIAKNDNRESLVYSLEEFKPRFDKHLRSAYLEGRFGAIPIIGSPEVNQDAI